MFYESSVLDPATFSLLRRLGPILVPQGFLLVGGTALAIQLGHRKSIDLDFFSAAEFYEEGVLRSIEEQADDLGQIEVMARAKQTVNLLIDSVKVDLIGYRYPLLEPAIEGEDYAMMGRQDIAAMKLSAITNRGSKKDFYDLCLLLDHFSLEEMLGFYREKYAGYDTFSVLRSVVYFDDADAEPPPVLLLPLSWRDVKAKIVSCAKSHS